MRILLSLFLMTIFAGEATAQLNDYKYIIVPKQFGNFKKPNQHSTSTLIKYLFAQKGYTVIYDDNLPEDLYGNPCIGLTVRLNDESSLFTTKTTLGLIDCNGREVFKSEEGKSKSKVFREAYTEAIKKAFVSYENIVYEYNGRGQAQEEPVTLRFNNDVKHLKENQETTSTLDKHQDPMVTQKATKDEQYFKSTEPKASKYEKGEATTEVTEQKATEEVQLYKTNTPVDYDIEKSTGTSVEGLKSSELLYAQEVTNGFQLVDSTPKVVLKMYRTAVPNVYTATIAGGNGVVYQKDDKWFLEYYIGEKQTVQELNIKF